MPLERPGSLFSLCPPTSEQMGQQQTSWAIPSADLAVRLVCSPPTTTTFKKRGRYSTVHILYLE